MKLIACFSITLVITAAATQPVYTDADLAADVISKALSRQSLITSLKGDVELTYTAGGDSQAFRVGFARVPPYKARLEITGLLGEILIVLTADGDRMMVHSKAERKAVVCLATRDNLTALLGMDLGGDIYGVLDWIEGRAPMCAGEVATGEMLATAEEDGDGNATVTWTRRESGTTVQVLAVNPDDGRVLFSRVYDADGRAETDIFYDDFADCGGFAMAYSVSVNREDTNVDVRFNKIKLNDEIKDRAFSVEPPNGTEVFYWDGLSERTGRLDGYGESGN